MIPWWGFWVQEFSNKDKQNKGLHGSTYPFLSHRGGMDGKFQPQVLFCIWGSALADTVQYCFLKAFCKNRPGDVLAGRCTPLVFRCLASGRFVRAVWRILWRCTLELFAAVILSHVQSSSCAQKAPLRQLLAARPVVGFLIISTLWLICLKWADFTSSYHPIAFYLFGFNCRSSSRCGRGSAAATEATIRHPRVPSSQPRRDDPNIPAQGSVTLRCGAINQQFKYLFTLKMARTYPRWRPVHMS